MAPKVLERRDLGFEDRSIFCSVRDLEHDRAIATGDEEILIALARERGGMAGDPEMVARQALGVIGSEAGALIEQSSVGRGRTLRRRSTS